MNETHFYQWVPGIVAVATVVANAAVTYSTVSRHERVIDELRLEVQKLQTTVAVIGSRCDRCNHVARGGGRLDN